MNKTEIIARIDNAKKEIAQIEDEIQGRRGVIEDVLRVTLPLELEQLHIMEEIVNTSEISIRD